MCSCLHVQVMIAVTQICNWKNTSQSHEKYISPNIISVVCRLRSVKHMLEFIQLNVATSQMYSPCFAISEWVSFRCFRNNIIRLIKVTPLRHSNWTSHRLHLKFKNNVAAVLSIPLPVFYSRFYNSLQWRNRIQIKLNYSLVHILFDNIKVLPYS